MKAKDWPRLALTALVMGLFGFAVVTHYSESIEQTLLSIVMLAVGYWLGSSKGSSDKTEIMAKEERDA